MTSRVVSRMVLSSLKKTKISSQVRPLSSEGDAAVQKLRGALEEYRVHNYSQEIPTRFKKEIVRAATVDNSNRIALKSLQRVLANINMDHRVTHSEMETIFQEVGGNTKAIPADRLMSVI